MSADHKPEILDLLVSTDARRLSVATSAPKPITVADHQAFREAISTKPKRDPIDDFVGFLRSVEKEGRK